MCGIFAFVGKSNNAIQTVFEGLKLLEYRGYDSWGIAIKQSSRFIVEKHVGKIADAKINTKLLSTPSSLAIGHTRWATHGGVTVKNAHPHLDCTKTIAVIHNGIIENFSEIKRELIKKGHTFVSETDTEVLPHLIEEYAKQNDYTHAVQKAFNRLQGLNAVVVALPTEIIAVKTGSPLVVGVGNNAFYLASDASGIVKHTKKVLFLEDNQMVILNNKLTLLHLPEGKEIKPVFHTLEWEFEEAEKGKFKHFLLKEIYEQPKVVENIALNYNDITHSLANLIKNAYGTFMLGCGTASYAALSGTYLFSQIAKKHVNFAIGSEFNYLEDYLTPKSLVIAISQSGETIDVVEPVENAKKRGTQIAAIVNVLGSTLYRQAHHKILLGAGVEKAVISTKSFVAMFSILLLTAYTLSKKQEVGKKLLMQASVNVKEILDSHVKQIQKLSEKLKNKDHIYLLGRGLSHATALEAALKIKETSYVHGEGFAGGELKHGVIALIEKGTPCIVFAPNDETYSAIISNAQEVKARGAFIVGIGPRENEIFDVFLKTADIAEATLIPQVVIAQLFSYYLALKRGIKDPDKPRNLAKSVTVK